MIEPNEKHVLKAVAWDALRAGMDIQYEGATDGQKKTITELRVIMDSTLEAVAKKLSNPETWEEKGDGDAG